MDRHLVFVALAHLPLLEEVLLRIKLFLLCLHDQMVVVDSKIFGTMDRLSHFLPKEIRPCTREEFVTAWTSRRLFTESPLHHGEHHSEPSFIYIKENDERTTSVEFRFENTPTLFLARNCSGFCVRTVFDSTTRSINEVAFHPMSFRKNSFKPGGGSGYSILCFHRGDIDRLFAVYLPE